MLEGQGGEDSGETIIFISNSLSLFIYFFNVSVIEAELSLGDSDFKI